MGAVLYECWIFVPVVAPEMLKFFICSDRTLNVQVSCKMMLKKNMEKQEKPERTAMPTVLKALERLNTVFCYAVYGNKSTSPQYARNCELVLLCGCPFGYLVSGRLKNTL